MNQKRRVEQAVHTSLRVTLLLSIPISGVFALFSKPLGQLIYGSEEVGFLIGVLAPIMPFMYLESVVDGLLKGLDQQVSSLKYSVLDSVLRITAIFFLVPMRGMQGFLFVMIVSNILTSLLNIRRLLVVTGIRMQWGQWLLKPLLAMTAGGVAALGLQMLLNEAFLPLLAVILLAAAAGVLLYALLLFLFGCITREDFTWLRRR